MSEDPLAYLATQAQDRPLIVGIYPGDETGVAVYDGEALWQVTSGSFWEMHRMIAGSIGLGMLALAVVEDSRDLSIYDRHRKKPMTREARDKLCRDVGRIDRDIVLWEAWLQSVGIQVLMVSPPREKKWTAARLGWITGWRLPTNQYGRNAAQLVWGRRVPSAGNTEALLTKME